MVLQGFLGDIMGPRSPLRLLQDEDTAPPLALLMGGSALLTAVWLWRRSNNKRAQEKQHQRPGDLPPLQYPQWPSSTLPFLYNTLDIFRHGQTIHHWFEQLCDEFQGRPFTIRVLGRPPVAFMSTPEAVEDVLKLQFDKFPKGPVQQENFRDILGFGIFAVDGERWIHQRKTASNLFTARSLRESMTTVMRKHTVVLERILRDAANNGTTIDLFRLLNRFTMEAFAEIGFGIEMGRLEDDTEHPFQRAFDSAQRCVALRFRRPPFVWKAQRFLGFGAEGQLKQDIDIINKTVLDIIRKSLARRQALAEDKSDQTSNIVTLFLDRFETDDHGTDREFDPDFLRDIVVNFLIAGRDTTAQTLSWLFVNLTLHPEVVAKIRQEIVEHLPELLTHASKAPTPTMEQVQQLTYLEAAIKETLRLHPSVPMLVKYVAEDTILRNGTVLRKGTVANIPAYGMARMRSVWGPDAKEFKPERWIDPATGKIINVSAYKFTAFNAGPRMCLGMNLAMLEMKIVVATLLSRLDLEVLQADAATYDLSVTLPVKGELRTRVRARAH